ncbi:unnamed protein product [Arabis nemorensis]|uniref:tRNA synthetases class I catalytic domain-containing protein n=1 Tax=Arabis nemorensis TaxID=586526 RepID=A0A565AVB8_9BRAS|nr:unnamed protein product [Arabis nemorensis]
MEQYQADLRDLQCIPPSYQLCASDQMDHIVKMIEKMVEKDIGYQVGGDVFFSAGKSPNYSQLLDHTQAGDENVVVVDPRIRNRADFALWKAAKPGEPSWKSPWGPGIHIECSAMSSHYREGEDVEEAKLSDVGIAKRIGDDLQNRQLGAIFFMSPESMCNERKVTHQIWAILQQSF